MDYQAAYYALLQAQRMMITPELIGVIIVAVSAIAGMIWKLAQQSKQIVINQKQIEANANALIRVHERIDALEKTRIGGIEEVSAKLENIGNSLARFEERMSHAAKEIDELKEEIKKFRKRSTD